MDLFLNDLRYAFRQIRYAPAFAFFVIATLAIGIGANTTIFGAVNAILLRPLPFPESQQLVQLSGEYKDRGDDWSVSLPNAVDWGKQSRSFSSVGYMQSGGFSLAGQGDPERVDALRTSANLFDLLGVKPIRGRSYTAAEDQPDGERVAVLGYGLWQRRFAGDPGIVGQTINLSGRATTVIGVMPEGFVFPTPDIDLYVPLRSNESTWTRATGGLQVIGRMKPGVTLATAQTDMDAVSAQLEKAYPDANRELKAHLTDFREALYGGEEIPLVLYLLLGSVGFVLLIACVNVANLLLARSTTREREIAIRAAIGADKSRVIRQLLTESMVLSVLGGIGGVLIAFWGTSAITRLIPEGSPIPIDFGIDGSVLAFTALLSVFTGVLFGMAPALHASSVDLLTLLGGRSGSASRRRKKRRSMLVVAEVALASVLLISAGLMIRSLTGLLNNDPGFQKTSLLTFRVALDAKYDSLAKVIAFQRQTMDAIRRQPGVREVGLVDFIPIGGTNNFNNFFLEGAPDKEETAGTLIVSPEYFDAMSIQLLRGRKLESRDTRDVPAVVVVSKAFADKYLPDQDPIGKRLRLGWERADRPTYRTIVGVANNVRHGGLDADPREDIYVPYAQLPWNPGSFNYVVRTQTMDPLAVVKSMQNAIWSVDRALPLYEVRSMERVIRESSSVFIARVLAGALGIFGMVALLLAALGLYGVISYSVAQRTYEMGVRTALGAETMDVLKLVIGQGMALVLGGLAIGLVSAFALSRAMTSVLYGVSANDPMAFGGMSAVLLLVALAATYIPARRASRIDPLTALRAE